MISSAAQSMFRDKSGNSKLGFLRSPLFLFALVIKLIAAATIGSGILLEQYIPFVDYFVRSGFADPYAYFYAADISVAFPFPHLMLYILAVPRWIFGVVSSLSLDTWLSLLLHRVPLLLADLSIFIVLSRWLRTHQRAVLYLYWLSPILFYINFVAGHLDAIPIALLFIFLYFLFKERFVLAMVFFGLSLATKTGMIILLPFVVVYLLLEHIPMHKIALYSAMPVVVYTTISGSSFTDPAFLAIAFSVGDQGKTFDVNIPFSDNLILYVAPIAYLFLLARSMQFNHMTRDVFLMFLGFASGVITLVIPPAAGWYFWIIPFLVYFYAKQRQVQLIPFVFLNIFYFGYFFVTSGSSLLDVVPATRLPLLINIVFSLLQGSLLLNILWIYKQGIGSTKRSKIHHRPYVIGLAGDSGSGKSTLESLIHQVFGKRHTLGIAGDDMHKWERGDLNWKVHTHLSPHANRLHDDLQDMAALRSGQQIKRKHYDHSTGRFTLPKKIRSKKVVIFQGLHALYLGRMQELLDLRIYLHPAEELRRHWKVSRDMSERGHKKEAVLQQMDSRIEDAEKYINQQKEHADVVFALRNEHPIDDQLSHVSTVLDVTLDNNINIELIISALGSATGISCEHEYDGDAQKVTFRGHVNSDYIDRIAHELIPELSDVVRGEPRWQSGYKGVMQLLVVYVMFDQMRVERYV